MSAIQQPLLSTTIPINASSDAASSVEARVAAIALPRPQTSQNELRGRCDVKTCAAITFGVLVIVGIIFYMFWGSCNFNRSHNDCSDGSQGIGG